ncbi:MAG TPA: Gfo/Idh/MocA family oxidoreductase [Verrucomicrobiae bacterium]
MFWPFKKNRLGKVRLGIIGMGNIGKLHADYLLAGRVSRCELTAICTSSPEKQKAYATHGLKIFSDHEALLKSGVIDAVVICTPHYQHPALGIAAFQAGVHVLMEKPIAAHKADAARLIAAHRRRRKIVFAAMFQMRAEPRFRIMRKLIRDGALGKIVRVNWINTDWFRTEAYYASGGWRATWRGEGGGVLLNQCLHNLDALQWLCGMPRRVRGFCQLGHFHKIEVEDNVTAYLEWANGATGAFISSTGEAPGTNRLEIAGTLGRLVLENNKLTFTRNVTDMIRFSKMAKEGFVKPDARTEEIRYENAERPHAIITQNFVDAILDGEKLIAPGAEGIHSLELANAITFSSLKDGVIELPMSGATWAKKLRQLGRKSKRKR